MNDLIIIINKSNYNKMSVRPITVSEEIKAKGHPFVNILATFGGLQGLLIYLNRHNIPITQNWFAQPGSLLRFSVLVGGGFVVGGLVGMAAFTDWDLLRLHFQHEQDKRLLVHGASIKHFS